jgi:hypothetical protein
MAQFLVVGAGGWLTAHQPTKKQPLFPSLSARLLASRVQKKRPTGVGGVFSTRGKWEVVAPAQGEASARREAVAGVSSGVCVEMRGDGTTTTSRGKREGGATRGDTTTRRCVERQWRVKRLLCNEMPCNNQPGIWEATAH